MEDTSGSEESGEGNEASGPLDISQDPKNQKNDASGKSKRSVKRQLKTFSFGKWQKGFGKEKPKKRTFTLSKDAWQSCSSVVSEASIENVTCICTGYKKTKASSSSDKHAASEHKDIPNEPPVASSSQRGGAYLSIAACPGNSVEVPRVSGEDFLNRRVPAPREKANDHGTEQAGETSNSNLFIACQPPQQPLSINEISINELTLAIQEHMRLSFVPNPLVNPLVIQYGNVFNMDPRNAITAGAAASGSGRGPCIFSYASAHTQVDYVHHLVPDLLEITNCSFYWGKMDRYKAEKQLDKKPEGTFLLRDSAQEEYLFSVSFRRYGRTLHARIEQLNHKFSFDSHDPNVFTSPTVCGLVEHYKNPICCMFFEPMLTIPVHRTFPFDLQHLCRAVISDRIRYDGINELKLPKRVKAYLKEYHYKQRVRVRYLDNDNFV